MFNCSVKYPVILALIFILVNPLMAVCRITILGDSLSTGVGVSAEQAWPMLLSMNGHIVRNVSGAGNTSHDALLLLQQNNQKTDISIIAIGANDALRGLPSSELEKNLEKIIDLLEGNNNQVEILLITPQLPNNYPVKYRKTYNDTYEKLAKKHKIQIITIGYQEAIEHDLLSSDRLHPNAKGQQAIYNKVSRWLRQQQICTLTP